MSSSSLSDSYKKRAVVNLPGGVEISLYRQFTHFRILSRTLATTLTSNHTGVAIGVTMWISGRAVKTLTISIKAKHSNFGGALQSGSYNTLAMTSMACFQVAFVEVRHDEP